MQRKASFVPGKAQFISNCQWKTQQLSQWTILTALVILPFFIHLATLLAIWIVPADKFLASSWDADI